MRERTKQPDTCDQCGQREPAWTLYKPSSGGPILQKIIDPRIFPNPYVAPKTEFLCAECADRLHDKWAEHEQLLFQKNVDLFAEYAAKYVAWKIAEEESRRLLREMHEAQSRLTKAVGLDRLPRYNGFWGTLHRYEREELERNQSELVAEDGAQ